MRETWRKKKNFTPNNHKSPVALLIALRVHSNTEIDELHENEVPTVLNEIDRTVRNHTIRSDDNVNTN